MKYIFEVTIKPGFQPEDYADAWVRASSLIQQAPGALGTELAGEIKAALPHKSVALISDMNSQIATAAEEQTKVTEEITSNITAIKEVTIAMPPRVRDNQTFNEVYISLAMPDRSSSAAIKMNNGTEISTYSVIRSKIFWVNRYSAPVPGRPVSIPGIRNPSSQALPR